MPPLRRICIDFDPAGRTDTPSPKFMVNAAALDAGSADYRHGGALAVPRRAGDAMIETQRTQIPIAPHTRSVVHSGGSLCG